MISIIPKLNENIDMEENDVSCEYIFIIDRSGSMSGRRISIAKDALKLCIKSLPVDSYLNIISFGSSYKSMFEEPVKITDNIINNVCIDIDTFGSDYGGTEMYAPIDYVLNCKINQF